jgi:hypothetical protein
LDRELKSSRRRSSHLDTLSNALGGRQKRRPASMGGSPLAAVNLGGGGGPLDVNTPRPHQLNFPLSSPRSPRSPRSNQQYTPRSVSDSHANHQYLTRSPVAMSNVPSSPLQQFDSTPAYVSVRPPTLPGHAFATRQPKGPPTNLGSLEGSEGGEEVNFGVRIRQKAIADLKGTLRSRRMSQQAEVSNGLAY